MNECGPLTNAALCQTLLHMESLTILKGALIIIIKYIYDLFIYITYVRYNERKYEL